MKENKYDDKVFFEKYSNMDRSKNGLKSAGEWETLKQQLPDFKNKNVLDLGCGFGWHCDYAVKNGANSVTGVDISKNMINEAIIKNSSNKIKYICSPIEEIDFAPESFDIVLSSLTLHYIKSIESTFEKVYKYLKPNGDFIFSVEHPIFTAEGSQKWYCDENDEKIHWPVDKYFNEGIRHTDFLGENVIKYHKTLTTYLNTLIKTGFHITAIIEPQPTEEHLKTIDGMKDELRRPMMLIVSANKN